MRDYEETSWTEWDFSERTLKSEKEKWRCLTLVARAEHKPAV